MHPKNTEGYKTFLLRHALGDRTCYRNFFSSSPAHKDLPFLEVLVEEGLMGVVNRSQWRGHRTFYATPAGKERAWGEVPHLSPHTKGEPEGEEGNS